MSEITHSSATGPASELEEGVFEELESVAIRFAGDSGDGAHVAVAAGPRAIRVVNVLGTIE